MDQASVKQDNSSAIFDLSWVHRIANSFVPIFFAFIQWVIATTVMGYAANELGHPVFYLLFAVAYLALSVFVFSKCLWLLAGLVVNQPAITVIRLIRYLPRFLHIPTSIGLAITLSLAFMVGISWVMVYLWMVVDGLITVAK